MKEDDKSNRQFIIAMGCVFAVGACLRLRMLSSQILLDDEWLSLTAVMGRTWSEVLTGFNPVDNTSLPFNVYDLALLHVFGWSELAIRLPVILAGLASLVILPLLVKKVFGERVALIFACLLAIAPFLVFYSRFARAYGFVALCCFSALLLFHQWLTTGKLRCAIGFVMAAAVAIVMHLLSVIAVFAPLVTAGGIALFSRSTAASSSRRQIVARPRHLVIAALLLAALLVPLCLPALRRSAELPWGRGHVTLESAWNAATLLSGTANGPLNALFYLLLLAGLVTLFKQNRLLGWIFVSAVGAYPVVLLAGRPLGLDTGAVILRYMIVAAPVGLTLVALALDDLITRAQQIPGMRRGPRIAAAAGFLVCLFAAGPLPALYRSPNNFAGHSAFQYSYRHSTWESAEADTVYPAFPVKQGEIPTFYNWLGGQTNSAAIVEYPFDICDYNDLFYYYQHFHHKRVLAGYCRDVTLLGYALPPSQDPKAAPVQVGRLCADDVLARVVDPKKLAFRNMVDILDAGAISRSGADFLILHKYVMALKIIPGGRDAAQGFGSIPVFYRSVDLLRDRFKAAYGTPVYEDGEIACYKIKGVEPRADGGMR
jgi:hypothetical protein